MGRKKTDGEAVDVVVPAGEVVEKGELYLIDGWTGFALDDIAASEVDRAVALDISQSVWKCKVPTGTCGTRGGYVEWTTGTFQAGAADLADSTAKEIVSVAKVEEIRNSDGYAALKLVLV